MFNGCLVSGEEGQMSAWKIEFLLKFNEGVVFQCVTDTDPYKLNPCLEKLGLRLVPFKPTKGK